MSSRLVAIIIFLICGCFAPLATRAQESVVDSSLSAYTVIALGSARVDSTIPFPEPVVLLQIPDTTLVRIHVRFPDLGILGLLTDTIKQPAFITSKQGFGYSAMHPLMQLQFPKMKYGCWIDVVSRANEKMLATEFVPFDIDLESYHSACMFRKHLPTTGLGSPNLRREFTPDLLPFHLDVNPGWLAKESIDTEGIYGLAFSNPTDSTETFASITLTPAQTKPLDSASWYAFRQSAMAAFGKEGIAVHQLGDFDIQDQPTRNIIKRGFEFITLQPDSTHAYVAAYLLPKDVMLLVAKIDESANVTSLAYLRQIARSFRLPRPAITAGKKRDD